jgi:hypothetical protein
LSIEGADNTMSDFSAVLCVAMLLMFLTKLSFDSIKLLCYLN